MNSESLIHRIIEILRDRRQQTQWESWRKGRRLKYRKKSAIVEATQWLQPGDDPHVEPFRSIDALESLDPMNLAADRYCSFCGNRMRKHGVLDGVNGLEYVCPGDYIVLDQNELPYRLTRGEFESQYEPYTRPLSYPKLPASDIEERQKHQQRRKNMRNDEIS